MPCGASVAKADVVDVLDKVTCLPVRRRLRIVAQLDCGSEANNFDCLPRRFRSMGQGDLRQPDLEISEF